MSKISVIVPVYNTEKYLRRCVDSILAQTFTDFELLLIDDGSTDGSGAICDEYAKKDSRVRVFHKENGGVSSARNLGLDNAIGEYITFIDSDDFIEKSYFEMLSQYKDPDIVVSYYIAEGWNGWISTPFPDLSFNEKNIKYFLEKYLISCNVPWGKFLKRKIVEKHKIRFDLNFAYGEDTLFIMDYLYYVNNVEMNSWKMYHYDCTNEVSLSKKRLNVDYYLKLIDEVSMRIIKLSNKFNSNNVKFKNEIIRMHSNYLFNSMDYSSNTIKRDLCAILNNSNVKEVLKDNNIKKSYKKQIFDCLLLRKCVNLCILLMKLSKLNK